MSIKDYNSTFPMEWFIEKHTGIEFSNSNKQKKKKLPCLFLITILLLKVN